MMSRVGGGRSAPEPSLSPALVERVLAKLGLKNQPTLDLAGLNTLSAAYCCGIPFDNIQKRIWFASDQRRPLTGGDPTEFFENWVRHGTGGTCWPINGGLYALVHALGFNARRITGSVIVPNYPQGANHGSVVVNLDSMDFLVDAWMGSFKALPLVRGSRTSSGEGIHEIKAVPTERGLEILSYTGWNREKPLPFRPEPEHDPVDHAFFLARYDRTKKVGFFNDALLISHRTPESILTIGRMNKIRVAADGSVTKTELTEAERKAALIEELGIPEEIFEALPPDVAGGIAPF